MARNRRKPKPLHNREGAADSQAMVSEGQPRILGFWSGELASIPGYRVLQPIRYAGVERAIEANRFSVCAPEMLAYGQGDTQSQALDRLREDISRFYRFLSLREDRLGTARQWMETYRRHLEPVCDGDDDVG